MPSSIRLWLGAGLCAICATATAQQVTLVLPDGQDELRGTLTEASLTLSLGEEAPAAAQDYVAAARADYGRLLTGLYAEG